MLVGVPFATVMLVITWFVLTKIVFLRFLAQRAIHSDLAGQAGSTTSDGASARSSCI